MATETVTPTKLDERQIVRALIDTGLKKAGIDVPNNADTIQGYYDYTEARKEIYKNKTSEQLRKAIEEMDDTPV